MVKRYQLDAVEAEMLQAEVDKDAMPTCVVAEAGELNRCAAGRTSWYEDHTRGPALQPRSVCLP